MYAFILSDSPILLWGLSPRQRLERVLRRAGVNDFLEDLELIPAHTYSSVLLIRGDYLYDDRVIKGLIEATDTVLQAGPSETRIPVAAHVPSDKAVEALELLKGTPSPKSLGGLKNETPETLSSAYEERLRKSDPPFVLPVTKETYRDLEERLFAWSYKGVTDLITKWAWPRPAKWCTRWCARFSITPNQVTF
ncbi:MAG: CDP-alcohol phosphatidyltransferase, partial [Deltaproteobacteria bacterium]